jgi:hypothetical protein
MNRTPGTVTRSASSTSTAKAGLAALAVAGVLDPYSCSRSARRTARSGSSSPPASSAS